MSRLAEPWPDHVGTCQRCGLLFGGCPPVPGSPLTSPFLSRSPIQAWHPAAVLQEMPRTYRRAAVGTSQPGAHCSSQAAQLVHQISSKEKDGVEGKTKIQDLTNTK